MISCQKRGYYHHLRTLQIDWIITVSSNFCNTVLKTFWDMWTTFIICNTVLKFLRHVNDLHHRILLGFDDVRIWYHLQDDRVHNILKLIFHNISGVIKMNKTLNIFVWNGGRRRSKIIQRHNMDRCLHGTRIPLHFAGFGIFPEVKITK